MEQSTVLFLDMLGRTIIGEKVSESAESLTIKNPAIVSVMPQQGPNGQQRMAIQIFPVIFKEFLADKEKGCTFEYYKKNITISPDATLDFKLDIQYKQIFSSMPVPAAPTPTPAASNAPTIKLFDD